MPPRSRNFNGCWTCRMRKIKCDAVRPKCLRCQKANLECKGYDLMLAWADIMTLDKHRNLTTLPLDRQTDLRKESGALRRSVELVRFPKLMLYETYRKLNHIVSQFDDLDSVSTRRNLVVGPFGVFSVNSSPMTTPQNVTSPQIKPLTHADQNKNSETNNDVNSMIQMNEVLESELESSIFSTTNNAYVHIELLDFAKLTILAIKGPRHKFSDQGMFHILYPKFFPNVDSDNWRPNSRILSAFFSQDDRKNIIIGLTISTNFQYFQQSTLASMRVSHYHNPWKRLVIPMLKQLFFNIICEEYPVSNSWKNHIIGKLVTNVPRDLLLRNIRFAIFCMCLSISWHERSLSGLKVKNTIETYFVNDELKVSIELRKIAINILNYHLDEYDANSDYSPEDDYDSYFLLALILQVHLDNLFGVFENYELMYAIGDFILKKPKRSSKCQTSLERHLHQYFNILNIIYESTQAINFFNYAISDYDQKVKYQDINENYDLTAPEFDKKHEFTSDESESDFDANNYNDSKHIDVQATSLNSQGLSFTVNFKGKSSHKTTSTIDPKQPKSLGFKTFQEGLIEKTPQPYPLVPSLGDGTIFLSYGLPKALLQLVQEVVHLTNHKNVFRTRGVAPRNFPRICAETEDKILNFNLENYWKLYDNEYNPITNVATKTFLSDYHEGLYHNVCYFHSALVVYFKRLITECPIRESQSFIESSFTHIEELITLNKKFRDRGDDLYFNPLFWPLLVCGCDIDLVTHRSLKERCQKLWNAECFQKFNYWRSKQILFEVWHRREEDGDNNSFMDLIREWEIVLCLG